MKNKMPKLTLKAAKNLAIQELGTAKGLIAHEDNNADYQRYEMRIGNHNVIISNYSYYYYGIACFRFGNEKAYFDIDTLQENIHIAKCERNKEHRELMRDMASCSSGYMFEVLLEEHGVETCRRMIDETAKKLYGTR